MMCSTCPTSPAEPHTWRGCSKYDQELLERLQHNIWRGVSTKVKHGETNPAFAPNGPQYTAHIIEYNEFLKLSSAQVQEMYRNQDFIIRNAPTAEKKWDLEHLCYIAGGDIYKSLDIQSMFSRNQSMSPLKKKQMLHVD